MRLGGELHRVRGDHRQLQAGGQLHGSDDVAFVVWAAGALLKGLDQLLREETSLPITVVEDPLSTVVMGTGRALDNLNELGDVCID